MVNIIGIGEFAVSSNEDDKIKTFALGSCVAVVVYNPMIKRLGMIHIALPDSNIMKYNKPDFLPGYFADTGVPLIFNKVLGGYPINNKTYCVSLFGGAYSRNSNDIFNIGIRNVKKIQEILMYNNIQFDSTNTGGYFSRTIEADTRDGNVLINQQPMSI